MADIRTTKISLIAPSATTSIALTSGVSWANGSFAQLLAATAAVAWLLQINFGSQPSGSADYEIDIAKGGAGSEIVIATLPYNSLGAGASTGGLWQYTLPSPISGINSNTRLSARLRNSTGSGLTQSIAITYIENSDATNNTASTLSVVPLAANPVSVTPNAVAWANSNYTELTPGINHEIQLAALGYKPVTGADFEFELATGSAGSETAITVLRGLSNSTGGQNSIIGLLRNYPLIKNTRVAIRYECDSLDF
jgi:hypothetical protein